MCACACACVNAWAILSMLTQNVLAVGCFQRILSRQFPEVTPTRPLSLPPVSLDVRNYWQSVICSRRPTELLYLIYRHLREPWPLPLAYCQDCLSLAVAVTLVYDDDVFTTICSIAHAHLASCPCARKCGGESECVIHAHLFSRHF